MLLVMMDENSLKHELANMRQSQLDTLSFLIRFNVLHINSFNNSVYLDIADLFNEKISHSL